MEDSKQAILDFASSVALTMTSKFVPFSQSGSREQKIKNLNWRVTLLRDNHPFFEFDFSAGQAYCPGYTREYAKASGRNEYEKKHVVDWECENGFEGRFCNGNSVLPDVMPRRRPVRKPANPDGSITPSSGLYERVPIEPDFATVLSSLSSDAEAIDCPTFEIWCREHDGNTDSIKDKETYEACLRIGLYLRRALGEENFAKLRELCQNF